MQAKLTVQMRQLKNYMNKNILYEWLQYRLCRHISGIVKSGQH